MESIQKASSLLSWMKKMALQLAQAVNNLEKETIRPVSTAIAVQKGN